MWATLSVAAQARDSSEKPEEEYSSSVTAENRCSGLLFVDHITRAGRVCPTGANLERYTAAFEAAGYDDAAFLAQLSAEDAPRVAKTAGMKPGHFTSLWTLCAYRGGCKNCVDGDCADLTAFAKVS